MTIETLSDWLDERLGMLVLDPVEPVDRPDRCVVGADGTEDSRPAAAWAARLAPEVDLVFAQARGGRETGSPPEAMEGLAKDARFAMDLLEDDLAGATVKEHVLDAFPARALVNVAETTGADLIATSPRHWTGPDGPELSTVSQTLVHHAPFPVLLAREPPDGGPIALALGEDRSSRGAAAWALTLADGLEADLVVAHAAPQDLERLELDRFADEGEGRRAVLLDTPVEAELQRFVEDVEPSMLVVGHGRTRNWIGSTSLAMLRDASCSVLAVPQPPPGEAPA